MKEDELLERIRKSAKPEDIPQGLHPDSIEKKLKSSAQIKRKDRRRYWVSGAAAACLALAVISWIFSQGMGGSIQSKSMANESAMSSDSAKMDTAADADAKSSAPSSGTQEEAGISIVEDVGQVMGSADDYKEIYEKIKFSQENTSCGITADEKDGASQSSNESAKTEASASDSVADTGGRAFSDTNVQVKGVDEGDIVKTDGTYFYVISRQGKLEIVKANGSQMELVSSVEPERAEEEVQEMYLDGDTLIVIAGGYDTILEETQEDKDTYQHRTSQTTHVYTYDITDRSSVKLAGHTYQEGYYRTSRKVGNNVYLFTQYMPDNTAKQENVEQYVPRVNGALLEADHIFLPQENGSANYLVITSVDITNPGKLKDAKAMVGGCDMFYVSGENIYITQFQWDQEETRTSLVKFSYLDGKIQPMAAASVKGYINDSFSLDEYQGYLRVVVTRNNQSGQTTNALYILDQKLELAGRIEDLAAGETVQSARFMGDKGYFVTFRNMDPLFSVDLSDPYRPVILGELKITGFSEYLHFYGENELLGIGWEVDPNTGERKGLKLSMFDISDPANVVEKDKMVLKDVTGCSGLNNYKAVMIDGEKNLFGLCYMKQGDDQNLYYGVYSYDGNGGFSNQFTVSLENENVGFVSFDDVRGLYIDNTVYLYTGREIMAYDQTQGYQETGRLALVS